MLRRNLVDVHHGLCVRTCAPFLLRGGKLPSLHLLRLLCLSLFFNRQTQHSLSSKGDSLTPRQKKKKKTPIQTGSAAYTHHVFVHRLQSFCQTKHINCFGESKRTSNFFFLPPAISVSSWFLISMLPTKVHWCWKGPSIPKYTCYRVSRYIISVCAFEPRGCDV